MISIPGNMVVIDDVGVMITGSSGIGKSELTLDLLSTALNTHKIQFISDDLINIQQNIDSQNCATLVVNNTNNHYEMFIRNIGLIDVDILFGRNQVIACHKIDFIIHLCSNNEMPACDCDNMVSDIYNIMSTSLRRFYLEIPTATSRNISSLVILLCNMYKKSLI